MAREGRETRAWVVFERETTKTSLWPLRSSSDSARRARRLCYRFVTIPRPHVASAPLLFSFIWICLAARQKEPVAARAPPSIAGVSLPCWPSLFEERAHALD